MTVPADIRYGRRGGRWASSDAGRHRQAITDALTAGEARERPRVELDPERLFHPETIAQARTHERDCHHGRTDPCPAEPDPDDLAPLTDLDRQALAMHPTGDAPT